MGVGTEPTDGASSEVQKSQHADFLELLSLESRSSNQKSKEACHTLEICQNPSPGPQEVWLTQGKVTTEVVGYCGILLKRAWAEL